MREIQQNRPQPPYQGYPVQPQPGAPYPQQPVQNPPPPMQQMQADGRTAGQRPQRQEYPEQRSKKQKAEKKFRKAQCPYCGKTINPLKSWLLKNQGEYICKKCGGRSNIVLDPAIYMLAFGAVAIDIIIFLIFALFVRHFNVLSLILAILPFLVFYILAAFLVRLKRPVVRRRQPQNPVPGGYPPVQRRQPPSRGIEKENLERTIVMDQLK